MSDKRPTYKCCNCSAEYDTPVGYCVNTVMRDGKADACGGPVGAVKHPERPRMDLHAPEDDEICKSIGEKNEELA